MAQRQQTNEFTAASATNHAQLPVFELAAISKPVRAQTHIPQSNAGQLNHAAAKFIQRTQAQQRLCNKRDQHRHQLEQFEQHWEREWEQH